MPEKHNSTNVHCLNMVNCSLEVCFDESMSGNFIGIVKNCDVMLLKIVGGKSAAVLHRNVNSCEKKERSKKKNTAMLKISNGAHLFCMDKHNYSAVAFFDIVFKCVT